MNALLEKIYTNDRRKKPLKVVRPTGHMVPNHRILQMLSAAERRDFGIGPYDVPARDLTAWDGLAFRR